MEEDQHIYFPQHKKQYHQDLKTIRRAFREDVYLRKRGKAPQFIQQIPPPSCQQSSKIQEKSASSLLQFKIIDKAREQQINEIMQIPVEELNFQNVIEELQSEDILSVHFGIIGLRRLLVNEEQSDMVQATIDAGLIKQILTFCYDDAHPQLKLQSAWILANLSAGNDQQCQVLAAYNTHIQLIQMLQRNEKHIVDQVIWAIGNLAASGEGIRNAMVQNCIVYKLSELASQSKEFSILSSITWVISNVLRCKPHLQFQEAKPALKFMCQAIKKQYNGQNPQISYYAIAPLITYTHTAVYDIFEEEDIFMSVIQFVNQYHLVPAFQPSIYLVGLLLARVSFHSKYLRKMMGQNLIKMCQNVCAFVKNSKILKEYLFFVSNIASEDANISDRLILKESFFQKLVELMKHSDNKIKKQVAYTIGNAASNTTPTLIYEMIQKYDVIQCFAELFIDNDDSQSLQCVMNNLNKLFMLPQKLQSIQKEIDSKKHSEQQNKQSQRNHLIMKFLETPNITAKLQQLQLHQNAQIQKALQQLIATMEKDGWIEQSSPTLNDFLSL